MAEKARRKTKSTGASRSFFVCDENTVIGYYTPSVGAVTREEASGKVRRNMLEPILVMILGRFAVDRHWQDKKIGSGMLKDAILRALIVAEQAGIPTMRVHGLSEEAKRIFIFCVDSMIHP